MIKKFRYYLKIIVFYGFSIMKIGDLAKATGCSVEAIRFYEKQGLLSKVERTHNNFRYYNEQHLTELAFICYCRSLGLQLNEIKTLLNLQQNSQDPSQQINALLNKHIKSIAERIHQLEHLRMELLNLKHQLNSDNPDIQQKLLPQHFFNFSLLK